MSPELELRALWTEQGVPEDRQNEILNSVKEKAMPNQKVGPFSIPFQAGDRVICNGYDGTVHRKLDWTERMYEVRLASGLVAVSACDIEFVSRHPKPKSETTDIGQQFLIDGVEPISPKDRLEARMSGAKSGGNADCDVGLFDTGARKQTEMF